MTKDYTLESRSVIENQKEASFRQYQVLMSSSRKSTESRNARSSRQLVPRIRCTRSQWQQSLIAELTTLASQYPLTLSLGTPEQLYLPTQSEYSQRKSGQSWSLRYFRASRCCPIRKRTKTVTNGQRWLRSSKLMFSWIFRSAMQLVGQSSTIWRMSDSVFTPRSRPRSQKNLFSRDVQRILASFASESAWSLFKKSCKSEVQGHFGLAVGVSRSQRLAPARWETALQTSAKNCLSSMAQLFSKVSGPLCSSVTSAAISCLRICLAKCWTAFTLESSVSSTYVFPSCLRMFQFMASFITLTSLPPYGSMHCSQTIVLSAGQYRLSRIKFCLLVNDTDFTAQSLSVSWCNLETMEFIYALSILSVIGFPARIFSSSTSDAYIALPSEFGI